MSRANDPDYVSLTLDGEEITLWQSYEIKISVLTQPAAFSLQTGNGELARKLLEKFHPGMDFGLSIAGRRIQSGILEGIEVPKGGATVVRLSGRDYLSKLLRCHIETAKSFYRPTYYELTRAAMDDVGITNKLVAGNGANLKAISKPIGTTTAKLAVSPFDPEKVDDLSEQQQEILSRQTGVALQGGGKTTFQAIRAKISGNWYDWLQKQYKPAGLFLWCAGNGDFVLSTLNTDAAPSYRFVRQRGLDRNAVNVLDHQWKNRADERHARYVVYGRSGVGPGGRHRITGEWVDVEMAAWGFNDVFVEENKKIRSKKEAQYLARRRCAENRRAGKQLSYTVRGHLIPTRISEDEVSVIYPDMTADVQDDELGVYGTKYIESVTYSRTPETTTTAELIDPQDLAFIAEPDL